MLGPDQPVILHLLDIPPAAQSLDGVKMELIDAALPLVHGAGPSQALSPCKQFATTPRQGRGRLALLRYAGWQPGSYSGSCVISGGASRVQGPCPVCPSKRATCLCDPACGYAPGVLATTEVEEACKGVAIAVMVGGFPRKAGMERKDVMSKNVSIYKSQAAALEKHAAKDVKARRPRPTPPAAGRAHSRPTLDRQAPDQPCLCMCMNAPPRVPSRHTRRMQTSARVPDIMHARRAAVPRCRCWSWPTRPTPTRSSCARTRPASRRRTSPRSRGWTTTAHSARRAGPPACRAPCRLPGISHCLSEMYFTNDTLGSLGHAW